MSLLSRDNKDMSIDTAGDMAIKDLTPQTTNLGDRMVKNMRICGSGIYTYHKSELPLLHLDPVPEQYAGLSYINVFRPADVLTANKDKFARVPIITGHHQLVNMDNAKQLVVGMVGDNVESEVDDKDGETYLYTTGTLVAGDGRDAYEQYGQLSVGYDPTMEWCPEPKEHKGTPYQAVLTGFNDINHLLICKTARGGPQCMVMDSLDSSTPLQRFIEQKHGGIYMGVFRKIFGNKLVGDSATVSVLLQSIALGADAEATVKKIRTIAGDAINEEMSGYLDELSRSKGESIEDIKKAVEIVDSYWNKLAGDESKDAGDESKDAEEVCPECGKEPCECGDEPKEDEPKTAGDSIDYEKLAAMVAEKMKPSVEPQQLDNVTVAMPTAGDSVSHLSSDDIMKSFMED